MCINCGDCMFDEKTDTCVIYTGKDYPRFGIISGQKYSEVFGLIGKIQTQSISQIDKEIKQI